MSKFLKHDWCNLNWSAWTPFDDGDFKGLHAGAGLYRIRVADSPVLAYIGQTGRDLRQRLGDLRRNTAAEQMPFNDPHTAAPSLWAWNDAVGYKYECSVAPSNVHRRERLAIECWLLWKYRLETGGSTLCNYGHFHPAYTKSRNRSTKLRGGRRDDEADQITSSGPLRLVGRPADSGWMGLDWSGRFSLATVPAGAYPALYRIFDAKTEQLLYIGETQNFGQRMKAHAQRNWSGRAPVVSYHRVAGDVRKVHLHELENDLIGGYYESTKAAPELQFSGGD
jgi:hypothetical protein